MTTEPLPATTPPAAPASFWKRRVVAPIIGQLRQGATPEKLALTIALGCVVGVFPILGAATPLCALVAWAMRLNQPVIQIVNYFVYAGQLALLIPFYEAGNLLFMSEPIPLSMSLIIERFQADFWQFLRDFGMVAVYGIVVWAALAPLGMAAIYYSVRPVVRRLARRST